MDFDFIINNMDEIKNKRYNANLVCAKLVWQTGAEQAGISGGEKEF
jgi:hypothetical protein